MMTLMAATPMTSFRCPPWLREQVQRHAKQRGVTFTEAMQEAALLWIAREERKKP